MLHLWAYVLIQLSKLNKRTIPIVNPKVNYELWMIIMSLCRFLSGLKNNNKVPFWWVMSIMVRGYHVWGQRIIGGISIPSSQSCFKCKTDPKNKLLIKNSDIDWHWYKYHNWWKWNWRNTRRVISPLHSIPPTTALYLWKQTNKQS